MVGQRSNTLQIVLRPRGDRENQRLMAREFGVSLNSVDRPIISPQSQYLALGSAIYDLRGERPGPQQHLRAPAGPRGSTSLQAMAFSPEGRRLAGVCRAGGEQRLLIVNMDDGKPSVDAVIESVGVESARWSSDGTGLRIGSRLYSADGKLLHKVDYRRLSHWNPVDAHRAIGIVTESDKTTLRLVQLSDYAPADNAD
jgi:dipeptidyl aminopeptidase/acylaminoacyl peptidase